MPSYPFVKAKFLPADMAEGRPRDVLLVALHPSFFAADGAVGVSVYGDVACRLDDLPDVTGNRVLGWDQVRHMWLDQAGRDLEYHLALRVVGPEFTLEELNRLMMLPGESPVLGVLSGTEPGQVIVVLDRQATNNDCVIIGGDGLLKEGVRSARLSQSPFYEGAAVELLVIRGGIALRPEELAALKAAIDRQYRLDITVLPGVELVDD